jgi:hypothetical protein
VIFLGNTPEEVRRLQMAGADAFFANHNMFASQQVFAPLLGEPVVSFDPDYCIIAEPTPRSVREAVESLRARNIPRGYVRARTVAKLAVERQRFRAFVEEIKARHGVPRTYGTKGVFSGAPFHRWRTVRQHARDFFDLA